MKKADALRAYGRGRPRRHRTSRPRGFLKFDTVGGVRPAVLSGRAVCVNGTVPGVICAKPIHLLKAEERTRPVPVDQLSIDIGASSREEAKPPCRSAITSRSCRFSSVARHGQGQGAR